MRPFFKRYVQAFANQYSAFPARFQVWSFFLIGILFCPFQTVRQRQNVEQVVSQIVNQIISQCAAAKAG